MQTLKAIFAWIRYWWMFLWIGLSILLIGLAAVFNSGGPQWP